MQPFRRIESGQIPPSGAEPPIRIPASIADSRRQEYEVLWGNLPPLHSRPFDWRDSLLAIAAGTSTLFRYVYAGGQHGVVRMYGVGYLGSSPIPAPGLVWSYRIAIDETPITPEEGFTGYYTVPCTSPVDSACFGTMYRLLSDSQVVVTVSNLTGLPLDLWVRLAGHSFGKQRPGVRGSTL